MRFQIKLRSFWHSNLCCKRRLKKYCGKTTLLNLILDLLKPDSGHVHKHAQIGLVSQNPYSSFYQSLTAERLVAEPLIYLGKKRFFKEYIPQVEDIRRYWEERYLNN